MKSIYYGSETISFLGPKIWELLPSNINDSENPNIFKSNIKSWKPENYPCRLCRLYITDIGFIRSSHQGLFLGKAVLTICSKFTGEHPC